MKKVLCLMCAMLLAGVAYADEMQQTPPPEIFWEVEESCVTITAVGEGEVLLYDEFGNLVDNPFVVARLMYFEGDIDMTVMATAQAEGCLVSEPVYETIHVPALERPVVPPPTFELVEDDNGIWVYANGENSAIDEVSLYLVDGDGEAIENPYYLEKKDEDYYAFFQALTIRSGLYDSDWAFYTVFVPALPQPVQLPAPVFTITENETNVMVLAACEEPGAAVSMYLAAPDDGTFVQIENPCYLDRLYEEQVFTIKAVAQMDGYLDSESLCDICVTPLLEPTSSPTINQANVGDGCLITIEPGLEEGCDIYWRLSYNYNSWDDPNWSDWNYYSGPLVFSDEGLYLIEAYAIAPGKTESEHVLFSFVVTKPLHFDFQVDDIFYKRTASGEVSVVAHGDYLIGYHGDIVIPSTVTHNGVTYMVTSVADSAFSDGYNGITSVKIGAYVTKIGNGAFMNCCDLNSVTLGDYVISIGDMAFKDCCRLATVTIGSGVRTIGAEAFAGCPALSSVICKPAVPPVMSSSDCFECYGSATLHVFPAVLESYRESDYWNRFTGIVGEDNVAGSEGDANGDGVFNLTDVIQLINSLINGN